MAEVVVFPDAVKLTVDYLRLSYLPRLEPFVTDVKVGTVMPSTRPLPFVGVQRAGGVSTSLVVDRPRLALLVWGKNEFVTQALAQLTRGLLLSARGSVWAGVPVYSVTESAGLIRADDPETGITRYAFTVEIRLRGTVAV